MEAMTFEHLIKLVLRLLIKQVRQNPKQLLLQRLDESNKAIVKLLEIGLATGRIKGFKPHPEAFVGYLIAHEAHHRGQIILHLKENGHIPNKKILYGLWEWGTKL
jgi:uncharacterized damage-inducible protein DinB